MRRHLMGLSLVAVVFLSAWAQQPLAPPAFDPAAVEADVREFYAAYWGAWDASDRDALANLISRDYVATSYVPGSGIVHDDYKRALAAIDIFFDAMRGQPKAWNRNLLTILVRNQREAVVAIRTNFLGAGTAQGEISLEVVHKEANGQWRLLRRWSEKQL